MNYCTKCGECLSDTAVVCTKCGESINAAPAKVAEKTAEAPMCISERMCPCYKNNENGDTAVCRFCQKNTSKGADMEHAARSVAYSAVFAVISLVLEAFVIAFMFFDLLVIRLDLKFTVFEKGVGVFSCFNSAGMIADFSEYSTTLNDLKGILILVGCIFIASIIICIIYYLYNLTRYSLSGSISDKIRNITLYNNFSIIAPFCFIFLLIAAWVFIAACLAGTDNVSVALSGNSIVIIVLTATQLFLNILAKRLTYR